MSTIRPILTLGTTQILGYGAVFYTFAVIVPDLSRDLDLSQATAFGAFSLGLLVAALFAPFAGRLIDRHGGRRMMALGSIAAGLGLALLSQAQGLVSLGAALVVLKLSGLLILYDAAFPTLAQLTGPIRARRVITLMTLVGGFASTLFWPLTQALLLHMDWRSVLLIYAALQVFLAAPLHFSLRPVPEGVAPAVSRTPVFTPLPPESHRAAMLWLGLSFSLAAIVFAAVSGSWVATMVALGASAGPAVAAGALMGPAQVGVRVIEMYAGQGLHPMRTVMISSGLLVLALTALLVLGPTALGMSVFAVSFGMAQGLTSIARGTAPLALFGSGGFAARLGALARARMILAALAPGALALGIVVLGPMGALGVMAVLAAASLAVLWGVPRYK
jgi:MFS family permease